MTFKFIGRKKEKEILTHALESSRAELIALYGRRRIGKTTLIQEFYKKEIVFVVSGLVDGNRSMQIKNFINRLKDAGERQRIKIPPDWIECFALLKQHILSLENPRKKKVVILDEFPWLDTRKSGFLPAFENFWNDFCALRSDLIVVLIGADVSYIKRNVIENKKGLHNRVTRSIKLQPFKLSEVRQYFVSKKYRLSDQDVLKIYMTFGGIPQYLGTIDDNESANDVIKRLYPHGNSYLKTEFQETFEALFDTSSFHKRIVEVLSSNTSIGMTRNDLLIKCGLESSGRFSKTLKELENAGYIGRNTGYKGRSKKTFYRIIDEFTLFYFFVIRRGDHSNPFESIECSTWRQAAFRLVCLKHIEEIKKSLSIHTINSRFYTWTNDNKSESIAIERSDDIINLCEPIYHDTRYSIKADTRSLLQAKLTDFARIKNRRTRVELTMITPYGVERDMYSRDIMSENILLDQIMH